MAKMRFNKNLNINRVVRKVVYTVLALYVGGTVLAVFGTVVNCTSSGFYTGLNLIGWTVGSVNGSTCSNLGATAIPNTIYAVNSGGVLSVVGIIAIAAVVLEFISFR